MVATLSDRVLNRLHSIDRNKPCHHNQMLLLPDHDKPWILFCDASGFAVGGALCQDHGAGPQPVVYISHKLSKSQMHWPTHDKEMFAVVYCFKSCRWYLQDMSSCTLITSHWSTSKCRRVYLHVSSDGWSLWHPVIGVASNSLTLMIAFAI